MKNWLSKVSVDVKALRGGVSPYSFRFRGQSTCLTAVVLAGIALVPSVVGGLSASHAAEPLGVTLNQKDGHMPTSFSSIVKQVRPAVVSIQSKVESPDVFDVPFGAPEGHPLHDFFRQFFDQDLRERSPKGTPSRPFSKAQGSGFIISEDGYVVTNNHVIRDAVEVSVVMDDGTEYDVELIGVDPKTDLALLKINTDTPLPYVAFSEDDVEIGDWVLAVGNPFGLGGSVTAGIVSARGRDIGAGPYDDFIQIDAPINRGNSGGPAFNLKGQVIGVNTAIFSPSGGNVGIAFAIPARVSMDVIGQLKEHGGVKRGWLGIRIQKVTEDIATSLGLEEPHGAIIAETMEEGPADSAGLKDGDIILALGEHKVKDARDLAVKVATFLPGTRVQVRILRGGKEQLVEVELGNQPVEEENPSGRHGEVRVEGLGLTIVAMKDEEESTGRKNVVVVDIDRGSEAEEKQLQRGDLILEVGGVAVENPEQVREEVKKAQDRGRKAILLRIQSGKDRHYVALSLRAEKEEDKEK